MSQKTSAQTTSPDIDLSSVTDNERAIQASIASIEETFPEMDRPSVLQYQVDPLIAETLKAELHTEQVYTHAVDGELEHRAWRFTDTSSAALVQITVSRGDDGDRVHYALPPIGETVLDLRWWAMNCHVNGQDFSITHLSNEAVADMMSMTPEKWYDGLTKLIHDSL